MEREMYSLLDYGQMIADPVRMGAYSEALNASLEPGGVVVDLGAGPGLFAMLACQAGAGKVYAIEPSDAIQVAREIATANGFGDRITFIQDRSTEVSLPEPADLIIFDLRGILPAFGSAIPDVIDARTRFLAPGGALIPGRDILRTALVESEESHRRFTTPWSETTWGLDLRPAIGYTTNNWLKRTLRADELLTHPETMAVLDYLTIEATDLSQTIEMGLERDGIAHGVAVWFDSSLAGNVSMSNEPGGPGMIYGQAFFPLPEAVPVQAGNRVVITFRADLIGRDYTWCWESRFFSSADDPEPHYTSSQSTFHGQPLTPEKLKRRDADHIPVLSRQGEIDRYIFEEADGTSPLRVIAEGLFSLYPDSFPDERSALNRITAALKGRTD